MFRRIYSLVVLGACLVPGAAHAAPGIPELFYGNGPYENAHIQALVDGNVVAETSVNADGTYGYTPTLLAVPDPENALATHVIVFKIDGELALQTAVFENGAITKLDLSTTTSGGSVSTVSTTAQTTVTTETLAPSMFTLTAFNVLMKNWGAKGKGNEADFNADGVVDVGDFNYLMIHWNT